MDLDDPVSRHVEGWSFPESRFSDSDVTVGRLLSNSAGVPLGALGVEYAPDGPIPPLAETLSGEEVRLGSPPGSAFAYSNAAYGVLELLVEKVTGRDLGNRVRSCRRRAWPSYTGHTQCASEARGGRDPGDHPPRRARLGAGPGLPLHHIHLPGRLTMARPWGSWPSARPWCSRPSHGRRATAFPLQLRTPARRWRARDEGGPDRLRNPRWSDGRAVASAYVGLGARPSAGGMAEWPGELPAWGGLWLATTVATGTLLRHVRAGEGQLSSRATGRPSSLHCGTPSGMIRARTPRSRSSRTASMERVQYGPRQ